MEYFVKNGDTFVYLIRNQNTMNLKIGFSECPIKRRSLVESGHDCDFVLLAFVKGDRCLEKELHDKFSDVRIWGKREWFYPSPLIYKEFNVEYSEIQVTTIKNYCCDDITIVIEKDRLNIVKSWIKTRDERIKILEAKINDLQKIIEDKELFLNEIIEEYENIESNYEELKKETAKPELLPLVNHLSLFCEDIGIKESQIGYIAVGKLWKNLQEWYEVNGFKKVIDGDDIWLVEKRGQDPLVTSKPQMCRRFQQLFPSLRKDKVNNTRVYRGIEIVAKTNLIQFPVHSLNKQSQNSI